jgi:hypothetical protein
MIETKATINIKDLSKDEPISALVHFDPRREIKPSEWQMLPGLMKRSFDEDRINTEFFIFAKILNPALALSSTQRNVLEKGRKKWRRTDIGGVTISNLYSACIKLHSPNRIPEHPEEPTWNEAMENLKGFGTKDSFEQLGYQLKALLIRFPERKNELKSNKMIKDSFEFRTSHPRDDLLCSMALHSRLLYDQDLPITRDKWDMLKGRLRFLKEKAETERHRGAQISYWQDYFTMAGALNLISAPRIEIGNGIINIHTRQDENIPMPKVRKF